MRGISAGDTLQRLVGKFLARQFAEQLRQAAGPANFGMSTRCGTDGLVHLARALLESDPEQIILCVDGVGAFDHVSRVRMFERLLATPSLRPILPFARLWYSSPSEAVWADDAGPTHVVSSAEGGEQGDALMLGLFCIALALAFEQIQNQLAPGDLVVAYFDDIYVFTRPECACAKYDMVRQVLWEQCRIEVHQGRVVCWNRMGGIPPPGITELASPSNPVWCGDAPAAANGVVVVGSPIGCDEFVAQHGARRLQEDEPLLAELRDMPSTQVAWCLPSKWRRTQLPTTSGCTWSSGASLVSRRQNTMLFSTVCLKQIRHVRPRCRCAWEVVVFGTPSAQRLQRIGPVGQIVFTCCMNGAPGLDT